MQFRPKTPAINLQFGLSEQVNGALTFAGDFASFSHADKHRTGQSATHTTACVKDCSHLGDDYSRGIGRGYQSTQSEPAAGPPIPPTRHGADGGVLLIARDGLTAVQYPANADLRCCERNIQPRFAEIDAVTGRERADFGAHFPAIDRSSASVF